MMNYFKTHPFAKLATIVTPILLLCILLMEHFSPEQAPEGFQSFIVAFEFAKTPEDINLLFLNLPPETLGKIDTGTYIDFGFLVAYSILLGLFFIKKAAISNLKWLILGIPLSALILLADLFENIILLTITKNIASGASYISLNSLLAKLHIITWLKWGGLAIVFFMISIVLFKGNRLSKIAAIICLSPLLLGIFAFNNSPLLLSLFTQSVFASFAVLIFYSFLFRKNLIK